MMQDYSDQENSEFINKTSDIFLQYQNLFQKIDVAIFKHKDKKHSSIGSHTRHVIDRINCFINGCESGEVDYDKRERNTLLEENPELCHKTFDTIYTKLLHIFKNPKKQLKILETISEDGYKINVSSTVERELLDIILHSVHHLATIKFILEKNNIEVAESFGKNPSTIIHEKK